MTESREHANLVALLRRHVADGYCGGDTSKVLVDSSASKTTTRPPPITGYVPDVYALLDDTGRVVIGEAKSFRDLENLRTEAQLLAFLTRCSHVIHSKFILAVPWPIERLAKSIVGRLQRQNGLCGVGSSVLSDASQWCLDSLGGRTELCRQFA